MYRLGIFDLDGTLADTLDSLVFSVNETLKEMGLSPIRQEKCRQFVGNGARVLIEKSLLEAGEPTLDRLDEAMQIYGRIFHENCTYHVVPYEGIKELLSDMKREGFKLAVLSNKPHKQTVRVVETVFGRKMFHKIQWQTDGIPRKPDPTAALQTAEELGILPEEAVYIGDSEVDIATGTNARMMTIGVEWGFRSRTILQEAGAAHIVSTPEEIMKLIRNREVKEHE